MSGPVSIREARPDDVPAIVALLADDPLGQTREDPSNLAPYRRAYDEIAGQAGNSILVAEIGGAVVGCLQFTVIPGLARSGMKRGQIEGVRIAANRRGRKLGERLMAEAIDRARVAGCGLVQLTTDRLRPDAHRFYERLGFVASHLGMKLMLE
jgi:ribosomal protein S18 acetylase RimI-like enzyme